MCVDASPDNCNIVLDEYEQRLTELRKESIVSGIERLQSLLEAIPLSTPENLEKIEALKASKLLISGQLALLSTEYVSIGSTVTTVKSTTYLFGFGAGAFVGLLIALQLAVIDKRIRSQRQLSQRLGVQSVIGNVFLTQHLGSMRQPQSLHVHNSMELHLLCLFLQLLHIIMLFLRIRSMKFAAHSELWFHIMMMSCQPMRKGC